MDKITETHTHNVPSIDDLYITCAELNNQILNHFLWILFHTICHPSSSPILVRSMKLIIEATLSLTHSLPVWMCSSSHTKEGRGRLVEQDWLPCLPVPSCCSHSSSAALFQSKAVYSRYSTVQCSTEQYSTVQYNTVQYRKSDLWMLSKRFRYRVNAIHVTRIVLYCTGHLTGSMYCTYSRHACRVETMYVSQSVTCSSIS